MRIEVPWKSCSCPHSPLFSSGLQSVITVGLCVPGSSLMALLVLRETLLHHGNVTRQVPGPTPSYTGLERVGPLLQISF